MVLHALYLLFNEGYTTSAGPTLYRPDLTGEAIRITRILHWLQPDQGEVAGLLALMLLLTDARRRARTDPDGGIVPLAEQDGRRWDTGMIAEGQALLAGTLGTTPIGPYQVQAAIAAVHDEADRGEDRLAELLAARTLTTNDMERDSLRLDCWAGGLHAYGTSHIFQCRAALVAARVLGTEPATFSTPVAASQPPTRPR